MNVSQKCFNQCMALISSTWILFWTVCNVCNVLNQKFASRAHHAWWFASSFFLWEVVFCWLHWFRRASSIRVTNDLGYYPPIRAINGKTNNCPSMRNVAILIARDDESSERLYQQSNWIWYALWVITRRVLCKVTYKKPLSLSSSDSAFVCQRLVHPKKVLQTANSIIQIRFFNWRFYSLWVEVKRPKTLPETRPCRCGRHPIWGQIGSENKYYWI